MAQAKIELKLGSFQFTGEAEAAWLEKQLDKLLEHIKGEDPADGATGSTERHKKTKQHKKTETLSAFLKSSGATTNQVKRFLATACWLTSRGTDILATGDIIKALSDNRQSKLTNAAECLNKNVTKGFCEKKGKQFYVTEAGSTSLEKAAE
jgi:hypothetical protein